MRLRIIFSYFALLSILLTTTSSFGQTSDSKFVAGLSATFLDYQGPLNGSYFQSFDPGISFGAHAYLNRFLNLSVNSAFVPEVKMYPLENGEFLNTSLIDVSTLVQFKSNNDMIFSQEAFFAPYISTGFGVNTASNNARVYVPAVLGIRLRINKNFSFNIDGSYKFGFGGKGQHAAYSAGFVFGLPTKEKPQEIAQNSKPKKQKKSPLMKKDDVDTDGDGIPDRDDKCPDVRGYVTYFGCPEPAGASDNTTNIAESTAIPETNQSDRIVPASEPQILPTEVVEADDFNPMNVPVSAEPSKEDLDFLANAMDMVHFETASNELTKDSYAVLDKVATILQKYPDYKLKVSGYTDNRGDSKTNKLLSITRAFNVKRYLVYDKDIRLARIVSDGYSSANPIANNDTHAGRKKNRRVEFELMR